MKVNCRRCSQTIKVNRSQVNHKLLNLIDKDGLYMCGLCRRRLGILRDPDATIKILKENR